jgi:hypothetical protein
MKKSYRKREVFVQDDKALNKPRLFCLEKKVALSEKNNVTDRIQFLVDIV